jgi:hypothetical protein
MNIMLPSPLPTQQPGEQLDLLQDLTPTQLPEHTAATLDQVALRHAADRQIITRAIKLDARTHGGEVNPNRVRALLRDPVSGRFVVLPQVIGATYRTLVTAGVLRHAGWGVSDDLEGGNAGRPCRCYIASEVA